jgi:hypothetical protein
MRTSQKTLEIISPIGIDVPFGRDRQARRDCSAAASEQYPSLPGRNGSLFRHAFYRTPADNSWSRWASDPGTVRQPFLKGHKNDYRDAEAIAEAVQRTTMGFVSIKTSKIRRPVAKNGQLWRAPGRPAQAR